MPPDLPAPQPAQPAHLHPLRVNRPVAAQARPLALRLHLHPHLRPLRVNRPLLLPHPLPHLPPRLRRPPLQLRLPLLTVAPVW